MTQPSTQAMQEFSDGNKPDASLPGFILLYADEFRQLPTAWALRTERAILGREGTLPLPAMVQSVSRQHAEVFRKNEQWFIRDLGSRNNTLVDGERITEVALKHLHEVRLGDVILKFVEGQVNSYAGYRIDDTLLGTTQRQAQQPTRLLGGFQIDAICKKLQQAASAPLSILLSGETGTGKEVAAQDVHHTSQRAGPFVAVNCAAIPENLIESELFGYRRGAFSGADRDKRGLLQSAHGGTLFLDEIGDMPLDAQAKLLRVLQTREVIPLGSTRTETVDLRVVAATHRDLTKLQREDLFRNDLYARLNEYPVRLPPLRERKEDVYLLFRAFLKKHGAQNLTPSFRFMTALLHYDWPYNVRELEACAKRAIALADGPLLDVVQLPPDVEASMRDYGTPSSSTASRQTTLPLTSNEKRSASSHPGQIPESRGRESRTPDEQTLRALLEQHQGNVAAVGRQLGKARMQVHRWMQRYGIQPDDYRH